MTTVPPELARRLSENQVIPFVGAGVSMSLGLPSYATLIREIGEKVGFEFEPRPVKVPKKGSTAKPKAKAKAGTPEG